MVFVGCGFIIPAMFPDGHNYEAKGLSLFMGLFAMIFFVSCLNYMIENEKEFEYE